MRFFCCDSCQGCVGVELGKTCLRFVVCWSARRNCCCDRVTFSHLLRRREGVQLDGAPVRLRSTGTVDGTPRYLGWWVAKWIQWIRFSVQACQPSLNLECAAAYAIVLAWSVWRGRDIVSAEVLFQPGSTQEDVALQTRVSSNQQI